MKIYALSIFLVAFFGFSSAWLDCPPGQRSKQFDKVVNDPTPKLVSWEECVPEESYDDPNISPSGERYNENRGQSSGSTKKECPPGTIRRTYQRPVSHYTQIPETYEQCDPEGPMNTNQNPAVSPTGQGWKEYNNPSGTSDTQDSECPPGTIRRTYQSVVDHHTQTPKTYVRCDAEGPMNTNQDPAVSPTGQRWKEYNNPSGTSNTQGKECPPGTIKRTYQHPVRHQNGTPQTYEQCDPEGPMNTNQKPAVSPTGESWNEWHGQPSSSVSSEHHGVPCPPGYIKVQVEEPTSHQGETPQVVVKCHPEFTGKNLRREPNGEIYTG